MNGQDLYKLHQTAALERNCLMDVWEDLDESAQEDWNRTAELATDFVLDELRKED